MSNKDNKLFSDSYSNRIYRDYIIPEEIKKVRVRFNKRDAKLCGLKFWCSGAVEPIAVGDWVNEASNLNYGLIEIELEQGERLIGV